MLIGASGEWQRPHGISAKVLVQAKCSAHHDIAVTYSRRELQDSVSAGTFAFYCERCNTYRVPTDEER
jgi:hypothetical protein